MESMTSDQFAAIMLVNKATPAEWKTARREMAIAAGEQCPDCGGADTESNGARRHEDVTFLCTGCGHQWDAAECGVTLPARMQR